MAQKLYEESNIQAIADAIRGKNGESTTYKTSEMADAITNLPSGGDIEVEPIVLSGSQNYGCAGPLSGIYINMFGDTISTKDLSNLNYMFYINTTIESIPFEINTKSNASSMASVFYHCYKLKEIPNIDCKHTNYVDMSSIFTGCYELTTLPYLYNAYPSNLAGMCSGCYRLKEIPEDYFDTWNFDRINSYVYSGVNNIFNLCCSLRSIPQKVLNYFCNETVNKSIYNTFYYSAFSSCATLDEIIGIPVATGMTLNTNIFSNTFHHCMRVKNLIFNTQEDGTPYSVNWKSQLIDLTNYIGWVNTSMIGNITDYNSGITTDKRVTDDATYQALKDDPDWFAYYLAYSRYNHDSAVATINSLPDTSAYLAVNGGTNTIKFKGGAGSKTDGGAINTLTEEEIAVATARGWTVSLV